MTPNEQNIADLRLNDRQQQAVEATEGTVRVVAGAGSGKTRVLAHRFAYIVNDLGLSPGNILCLTFTNKAAQEMKHRIARMVDRGSVNDFVCTIHSFCVKFLRREIYRIGYPKNFMILDEEDARQLARQAMEEFGIDRKKTTAERFLKQVAGFKGWDPTAYIQRHLLPNSSPESPDAIVRYIRLQLKSFCLDYDDLLYFTLYILDHFPDARQYWTDKLNYVMVDEVQDCSGDDWKLLRAITSYHGNLFVVGDPDQAIYEWRGANPKIFVDFHAATDIILDRNYRSTPDILDVANAIIANNVKRVPKDLYTARLNERRVVYRHEKSETEEAENIASTIAASIKEGRPLSDHAILYRASHLSRRLEQALVKQKIPYTVWGGVKFFERREIKDALAYMRLTVNRNDDISFRRIVNVPSRKFGAASLEKLQQLADSEGESLFETLRLNIDRPPFNRKAIRDFVELIDQAALLSEGSTASDMAETLLQRSGLTDSLRNDAEEERLENLTELMNAIAEFDSRHSRDDSADLRTYLQEVALYTNLDLENDKDKVRMMTIHQSKGLEFPVVFVAGLTEGVFPSHRTIRERRLDGEEEERRLMYVAVTRAESQLYLSESEGFLNEHGGQKYPSRFLAEIPEHLLEKEGNPDPTLFDGTRALIAQLNSEIATDAEAPMAVGTKVIHKVFGEGVIEGYDPQARSYRVRFGQAVRQLVPRVLTKL